MEDTTNNKLHTKLVPQYTLIKCDNCNGYGTIGYGKIPCPTCKGLGSNRIPLIPLTKNKGGKNE